MAKARAIAKRRKAVSNIKKITHTMQLIATARYQKAYKSAVATQPYTKKITELVGDLSSAGEQIKHPLLSANEGAGRTAHLVITSNRGLCGGYNASILRAAIAHEQRVASADTKCDLYAVGKKGISYYAFLKREITHAFRDMSDMPTFPEIEPIAADFMTRFINGDYESIHVTHMRFHSVSKQTPETIQLLPISQKNSQDETPAGDPEKPQTTQSVQYDFSPEPEVLLAALLPATVKVRLFQCFTDATVSEQMARMVAMKAATDAARDMIKMLGRSYNRARQSQITMELLDIMGGAEAVK